MSNLLKVIMVAEYPFAASEHGRGGLLQSTFHLVEGFVELGDRELELHVLSQTPACDRYEDRCLGSVHLHFVPKGNSVLAKFILNPLRLLFRFLRLKAELRPDLIHAQGAPNAILLSQCFGKHHIQTIHGVLRNEQAALIRHQLSIARKVRMWINERLEGYYLGRIRNLIVLTKEIEQIVTVATHEKVRLFPSYVAIDPAFFARPHATAPGQACKILFVAAITPRKGLHFLLEAFERTAKQFPGCQLRIVGIWDWAREYVDELRARHHELIAAGNIVFTGGVDRDQIAREFSSADLLVLSSLAESAPAVVSQAMAGGLPVVATAVGGVPEMITDNATGLLVEAGSAEVLHDAMVKLVSDASLRTRLGSAARAVAIERYYPASVARVTRDAYKAVLS